MYCRYCGAEMQEDDRFCASCGEAAEQPKKTFSWKPVVAIVCCMAVVVGLVAMIWFGMGTAPKEEDITVKVSYTGTKEQVLSHLDTVVATAGDLELTNRELQVAYWSVVYDFISYYGDYASTWIDFTKPLDQQYFDGDGLLTWQHYFLDSAIKTWRRYEVLVAMAQAENIPMSQSLVTYFEALPAQMESLLPGYKLNSVDELVAHDYGVGSNYASYEEFMKLYYYSNEQYERLQAGITATDAELEAFYANNLDSFKSAGCSKEDGSIVDVRHILIAPGEDDEKPFTDAMWADAEAKANALLNTWLQGAADEEFFAELAKTNSSCPSAAQGGMIADVVKGQTVKEFEDWCMAEHQYGDYGIVKTDYGYHLMFYISGSEMWRDAAQSSVISQKMNDLMTAEEEKYPLKVEYSKIWLGEATFG